MIARIFICLAVTAFALGAITAGAQTSLTWAQVVDYVAQHGKPSQFYGPVAGSFGLSAGTPVDYRMMSRPGNPAREFYVTADAVILAARWSSGASRGYVVSKAGVLLKALDRSKPVPLSQAAKGFDTEKAFWIGEISGAQK